MVDHHLVQVRFIAAPRAAVRRRRHRTASTGQRLRFLLHRRLGLVRSPMVAQLLLLPHVCEHKTEEHSTRISDLTEPRASPSNFITIRGRVSVAGRGAVRGAVRVLGAAAARHGTAAYAAPAAVRLGLGAVAQTARAAVRVSTGSHSHAPVGVGRTSGRALLRRRSTTIRVLHLRRLVVRGVVVDAAAVVVHVLCRRTEIGVRINLRNLRDGEVVRANWRRTFDGNRLPGKLNSSGSIRNRATADEEVEMLKLRFLMIS